MPAIAVPRGAPQGRARMTANPDGWMRLLQREGLRADIGITVVGASKAGGRLGPELLEYRNPLIGHGAAFVEVGTAQRLEFLFQPADAHAQRDTPARQHIKRCDDFRGQNRVAVGQDQHRRNQAQPFRRTRHHAENGEGLQRVPATGMSAVKRVGIDRLAFDRKDNVVRDHRRVKAKPLAFACQSEHAVSRGGGTARREVEAIAHDLSSLQHLDDPGRRSGSLAMLTALRTMYSGGDLPWESPLRKLSAKGWKRSPT